MKRYMLFMGTCEPVQGVYAVKGVYHTIDDAMQVANSYKNLRWAQILDTWNGRTPKVFHGYSDGYKWYDSGYAICGGGF